MHTFSSCIFFQCPTQGADHSYWKDHACTTSSYSCVMLSCIFTHGPLLHPLMQMLLANCIVQHALIYLSRRALQKMPFRVVIHVTSLPNYPLIIIKCTYASVLLQLAVTQWMGACIAGSLS
jgi:hypothetical protein